MMLFEENYKTVRRESTNLQNFMMDIKVQGRMVTPAVTRFKRGLEDDALRIQTVHGIERVFQRTSRWIERILIMAAFIAAISVFTRIALSITHIYRYKPLQTVISDLQYPIFKIPFPEITICNQNRLNWQRYEEAKEKFLLEQHLTSHEHEEIFRRAVNAYDTMRFGHFQSLKELTEFHEGSSELLQDLDYVNLTHVVEFMAWRCNEMFSQCSWLNATHDCCELFTQRKSQKGLCLSFNTIESKEGALKHQQDPYYPWSVVNVGDSSGLYVRINIIEDLHSPLSHNSKGILVMINEPYSWSYIHREIPTNTHTYISIDAFLRTHHINTRFFSNDVRQCIFEDELKNLFYKSLPNRQYMYENCQAQCEQEYTMEFCNCSVDLFYPPSIFPPCRIKDLPCLYRNDEKLKVFEQVGETDFVKFSSGGMYCPCYMNCKSLRYLSDYRIQNLAKPQMEQNGSEIELSVYFLWSTIKVYQTRPIYTFIDLMASLGGVAGLCVGSSLLGIMEFLYFIIFDISKHLLVYLKTIKKSKERGTVDVKPKHIDVKECL
ncbi:pickpocket protein 19-like isoform X1 [Musca autumnalis]|uniref:pickpocket protein 19-like isoform X1 n=1 Tax=Musca autumnalis TaxID=221902 RepID=UPI003CEB593C